jgi:alpha-D-ribose 1-methylphosphonate 5-triphosphate synthase subunit PhnI
MPITQFLGNAKFDPETRRIMGLAFEMTRLALGLADRGDRANELVANLQKPANSIPMFCVKP